MCDPVTAIAVGGQVAAIAQQQQQAHQQNRLEEVLYGQRKESAFETFAALQDRTFQEREKAAQDVRAITLQARQAAGQARLQALESGTGGRSVEQLIAQFESAELGNVATAQQNLAHVEAQIERERRAAARIQGPAKTLGPLSTKMGLLVSGLQVGSAAAGARTSATTP